MPQIEKRITGAQKIGYDYLWFTPEGYSKSKKWPLILFLHGAGERGSSLRRVAKHGPPKIAPKSPDFPFLVVSPQCPHGQKWNGELLLGLIDHLLAQEAVDPSRVYATGVSMGGFGVWDLALNHPERFAAVAPICGGGTILPLLLPAPGKTKALRALPVWAFHGARDEIVRPAESVRMIEALTEFGNKARLTIYDDLEHDCWTRAYEEPGFFEWLLEHRQGTRQGPKSKGTKVKGEMGR